MQIRPIERRPKLSRQAGEYLARLISEGAFKSGDRLPSEAALARQLGVSRPTVREAIGALEARGLVDVRPRSGVYVASAVSLEDPEGIQEMIAVDPARIWDLLEIRKIIDAEGAALAAERRNAEDLKALRALAEEALGHSTESLVRRETGGKAYVAFFALLAGATHNTLFEHLRKSIDRLVQNALPASRLRLARYPEAGEAIRRQLLAILEAVEARAPSQARRAIRIHLDYLEKVLRKAFAGHSGSKG
jgi:GntR family transcriptional repressor for pyruvate dehydrogenase complex